MDATWYIAIAKCNSLYAIQAYCILVTKTEWYNWVSYWLNAETHFWCTHWVAIHFQKPVNTIWKTATPEPDDFGRITDGRMIEKSATPMRKILPYCWLLLWVCHCAKSTKVTEFAVCLIFLSVPKCKNFSEIILKIYCESNSQIKRGKVYLGIAVRTRLWETRYGFNCLAYFAALSELTSNT